MYHFGARARNTLNTQLQLQSLQLQATPPARVNHYSSIALQRFDSIEIIKVLLKHDTLKSFFAEKLLGKLIDSYAEVKNYEKAVEVMDTMKKFNLRVMMVNYTHIMMYVDVIFSCHSYVKKSGANNGTMNESA